MSRRQAGSVDRLPSGAWRARHRGPDGYRHAATFRRKADADAWLAAQQTDRGRGAWLDPRLGRLTFAGWVEDYFAGSVHKRATTLARDRTVARAHLVPALGPTPLANITPLHVRRLVETMATKLAPATVRTNYGVLRAILNAAVSADLIVRSPCRGIQLPAERRGEIRFLSPEELGRLAEALPIEYRPMVYVAGVLGLRWSEVAGLRVGRVDLGARTLTVAETLAEVDGHQVFADVKTRAGRRTLTMPGFVATLLAEHLLRRGRPGAGELIFVGPEGGPLRVGNFRRRVWAPAVRATALDGLTFHGLRHSAVGLLVAVGAPDFVMQERMGHSSARVTRDVYGHVLPATDAAVTTDLEALFSNRWVTFGSRRESCEQPS